MWQVVGGWKQEAGAVTNSEHLFRERSFAGLRSWREKQASLAWNIFDTRLLRATVSTPMLSPARLCGSSAYSGVMGHLPHARGGEEGGKKREAGKKWKAERFFLTVHDDLYDPQINLAASHLATLTSVGALVGLLYSTDLEVVVAKYLEPNWGGKKDRINGMPHEGASGYSQLSLSAFNEALEPNAAYRVGEVPWVDSLGRTFCSGP